MYSNYILIRFSILIAFFFSACGSEEQFSEQEVLGEEDSIGKYGDILLTYSQSVLTSVEENSITDPIEEASPNFHFSARFVKIHEINRNEANTLWREGLPETNLPFGECELLNSNKVQKEQTIEGSLVLLDAGELVLRAGNKEYQIPNWSFPSVFGGIMTGILYGGETLDIEYLPNHEYQLIFSGSNEIQGFEVSFVAPHEFESLTIAGKEVGIEPITFERNRPIEVGWEGIQNSDEIITEFSYRQFNTEQRYVCRSYDKGSVEIPIFMVNRLWDPEISDLRLSLNRISRRSVEISGLDDAEILFVVTTIIPLNTP